MILYKYSGESGIRILDDLKLKVTPPNELNDPFELTPRSRNTMTRRYFSEKAKTDPEHFRWVYDQMVEKEGFNRPFSEMVEAITKLPRKSYSNALSLYRQELVKRDLRSRQEASKHMVVLCLSAANNSVPMWSHYGDHHKGVVVGFDSGDSCFSVGSGVRQVVYTNRRVNVDPLVEATEQEQIAEIEKIILTKSRDWEYEREYRACFVKHDVIERRRKRRCDYFIDIWPQVIREVVFGCCIPESYEKQMRKLLALSRFSHVRVFRARQHKDRFALEIVPV